MPLILLVIGLVLIIYNYRAIKREVSINQDDKKINISFKSILSENKEEISDYKIEIGLLRKDMAESLTELQEEIVEIKNNINKLKENAEMYENKEESIIDYSLEYYDNINNNENHEISDIKDEMYTNLEADFEENDGVVAEINFLEKIDDSAKTQNIKMLLEYGLTEEQICHELSVSKGEVLLVKGLFKK